MKLKSLFLSFLFVSVLAACTEEEVVPQDIAEVEVRDTVTVIDTLKETIVVNDTLQINRVVVRSDAQYVDDSFISSLTHNDLKNTNQGDRYLLGVRAFLAAAVGESNWDSRALIRFNEIDFLPSDVKIDSAILTLSVYYQEGCNSNDCAPAGTNYLSIHPLIEPWDEYGVTWENQPLWDLTTEVKRNEFITFSDTNIELDITPIVQYWIDSYNYGMVIKMQDEGGTEKVVEFFSSDHFNASLRPQLTLYYNEK